MSLKPRKPQFLQPNDVITEARRYLGVPYRHQGASFQGVDCVGYLYCVGSAFGLQVLKPCQYGYGKYPDMHAIVQALSQCCIEVPTRTASPGDVLLLMVNTASPIHTAFRTDIGIIHAIAEPPYKVVEHSLNQVWRRRIKKVFRPKLLVTHGR